MQGGVKVSDKPPDLRAGSAYLRHPGLRHGNLYPKIFKYPLPPRPHYPLTGWWEQSRSWLGGTGITGAVIPAEIRTGLVGLSALLKHLSSGSCLFSTPGRVRGTWPGDTDLENANAGFALLYD